MNIFGPTIGGDDIRLAAEETTRKWLPTYLDYIGQQKGFDEGALPLFRSYTSVTDFDKWPEDQLPALVIVAPGLREQPERNGTLWTAEWSLGLAPVVSGRDQMTTLRLLEVYVLTLRTIFLQHSSMGGFATKTRWIDESYDDLSFEEGRTMAAGLLALGVVVEGVLDKAAGPQYPLDAGSSPPEKPKVAAAGVTTKGIT